MDYGSQVPWAWHSRTQKDAWSRWWQVPLRGLLACLMLVLSAAQNQQDFQKKESVF